MTLLHNIYVYLTFSWIFFDTYILNQLNMLSLFIQAWTHRRRLFMGSGWVQKKTYKIGVWW